MRRYKTPPSQGLTIAKKFRYRLIPANSRREFILWQGMGAYRSQGLAGLFKYLAGQTRGMFRRLLVEPQARRGRRARLSAAVAEGRYTGIRDVFVILAGVPIDDTGGGARCTQLALELLRQGSAVIYINKFPKYESSELNLTISDAHLWTYWLAEFDWKAFTWEFAPLLANKPLHALVEYPIGDFLPLISDLRRSGAILAYDLVDAWDTSLGNAWYSAEVERQIIAASAVLVATEASLVARLERLSGRPVVFLPNAVNSNLFGPQPEAPRPADFPQAEWSVIYIGALWGEWFDWDLLTRIARCYPEAAVVVVGDYRGQCPNPPSNLYFLGLKAQRSLPPYLEHADVAIIPWKVNPITQATSPLKLYEYLAMHKPVVAPELDPLRDMPGVFLTPNAEAFIAKIAEVRQAALPEEELDHFIAANNWQARVNELLQQIDLADGARDSRTGPSASG